jgi:predicted Zn-dependent protease with MMP-like domain
MRESSTDRFMRLVAEAIDALPTWVHETMENVEVFLEDEPPPDDPNLLGHFEGVPLANRGGGYFGAMPDRITLYVSTIEREAGLDEERLRRVIAHTVAHEIAHHFGIDDDRLHEIGAY